MIMIGMQRMYNSKMKTYLATYRFCENALQTKS